MKDCSREREYMSAMSNDSNKPYIVGDFTPRALTYDETSVTAITLQHASWLGIVAGLRSMTPLTALTWTNPEAAPWLRTLTAVLAVGEIVGDKLPFTPSRLKGGALFARLAIGATAGVLLCKRSQQPLFDGAIHGFLGAALGSIAGYSYRTVLSSATGIPDLVWAIGEDAVALGLSVRATASDLNE
jgi:uncharacterized membrane protein